MLITCADWTAICAFYASRGEEEYGSSGRLRLSVWTGTCESAAHGEAGNNNESMATWGSQFEAQHPTRLARVDRMLAGKLWLAGDYFMEMQMQMPTLAHESQQATMDCSKTWQNKYSQGYKKWPTWRPEQSVVD